MGFNVVTITPCLHSLKRISYPLVQVDIQRFVDRDCLQPLFFGILVNLGVLCVNDFFDLWNVLVDLSSWIKIALVDQIVVIFNMY